MLNEDQLAQKYNAGQLDEKSLGSAMVKTLAKKTVNSPVGKAVVNSTDDLLRAYTIKRNEAKKKSNKGSVKRYTAAITKLRNK